MLSENDSTSSIDTSNDDSGFFTRPTLGKYQIHQNLILHWRRNSRMVVLINALYAIIWLLMDSIFLRHKTSSSNYTGYDTIIETDLSLTKCDWHGVAGPALLLFSALISICELYTTLKIEGMAANIQTRIRIIMYLSIVTFIFILGVGAWV